MALTALLVLVAIPVVEIWAALVVAGQIGGFSTALLIVALSCVGVWMLKQQGIASWRAVSKEVAEGRSPGVQMLDGVLAMIGAALMVVPGFVTAAAGILLLLPPVRTLLRPVILAWMTKRAATMANRSRVSGVFVSSRVDQSGQVYNQTTTFGEVIDAEGWDVDPADFGPQSILPGPNSSSRDGRHGVIDTDGRPSTSR